MIIYKIYENNELLCCIPERRYKPDYGAAVEWAEKCLGGNRTVFIEIIEI